MTTQPAPADIGILIRDAVDALGQAGATQMERFDWNDADAASIGTDEITSIDASEASELVIATASGARFRVAITAIEAPDADRQKMDDAYIAAAREKWCSDDLEIDDKPIVSLGGDPGAWVAAFVWVTDEEAGLENDEEEEE